jgi:hypothetical protein
LSTTTVTWANSLASSSCWGRDWFCSECYHMSMIGLKRHMNVNRYPNRFSRLYKRSIWRRCLGVTWCVAKSNCCCCDAINMTASLFLKAPITFVLSWSPPTWISTRVTFGWTDWAKTIWDNIMLQWLKRKKQEH